MIKELSFKTKFGWINIREVNERIVSIKFGKKNSKSKSKNLIKVKNQINEYINGRLKKFNCSIFLEGTNFQKKFGANYKEFHMAKRNLMVKLQKNLIHLLGMLGMYVD